MRLYCAKLLDEHNKRQIDYRLEWQNRLAIITATIVAIGVAIGIGVTLILKQRITFVIRVKLSSLRGLLQKVRNNPNHANLKK